MKHWITAAAFMASTGLIAQQREGTVLYEKKMNMHKNLQNEQMKAFIPEFRNTKHMLLFSDSVSIYRMIPEEEAPDPFSGGGGGGQVVIRMGGGGDGGDMYKNFSQQRGIQSLEMGGKNFLIIDTLKPQPWKITEETKKILGYTCYKATRKMPQPRMMLRTMSVGGSGSSDTLKNSIANTPKEIEVIAWYTNDIITPAGPENYGQLPGLILQLDIDNGTTVFNATEVKVTLNKKDLKEPTKGKAISRTEYQKLMTEMMNNQGPGMFQRNKN